MKLFISGDPHVNLGSYNHTTGEMCARRRGVVHTFAEGLTKAKEAGADCYVHTGDFVDGPLSSPNLTTPEQWVMKNLIRRALRSGLVIGKCPVGNHDIPKSRYTHKYGDFPTAWAMLTPTAKQLPNVHILNFCPNGQEAAEEQFEKVLKWANVDTGAHHLFIAHHLFEGRLEFNMNSTPTHENWFKRNWVSRIKKTLGKNVTIVLGHDHEPWEEKVHGIRVINVGSPTQMKVNDTFPRRFMTWEDGEIEFIPVNRGMKEVKVTELSDVPEGIDRVVLDIEVKTHDDEVKLRNLIDDLKARGVEYVDKTNLFKETTEITGVSAGMSISQSFKDYLEEQNLSNELKEVATDLMVEMGML